MQNGTNNSADHKIMVRSDARAMGAVTALDTRVSSRWQKSNPNHRTFKDGMGVAKKFSGTSVCVSYKLDADGNKVEGKIFNPRRENIHAKQRNHVKQLTATDKAHALAMSLPSIHN